MVFTEDFPDWVTLREVRSTNAPFDRALSRSFWPSLSYQIKPGQSKEVALRVLRSMLRRGEVTVSRQPTNRPTSVEHLGILSHPAADIDAHSIQDETLVRRSPSAGEWQPLEAVWAELGLSETMEEEEAEGGAVEVVHLVQPDAETKAQLQQTVAKTTFL